MSSPSERAGRTDMRVYDRGRSVVFLKTHEEFGGLSNMAGGFPLTVNRLRIHTSEALYQACRFPHRPELQRLIIGQRSPMTAKMKSLPYRHESRSDWERVRVQVMRWCLRVKLAQNWTSFSDLLLRTGDRPIVEHSSKDDFWGAKEATDGTLRGRNVLGRLLMELREAVRAGPSGALLRVEPLAIPQFLLDGHPIEAAQAERVRECAHAQGYVLAEPVPEVTGVPGIQGSLFEAPAVKEGGAPYVTPSGSLRPGSFELPAYTATSESSVPWMGTVPEHWGFERAKWLFGRVNRPVRQSDEVVTCFRDGTVTLRSNRRVRGFTEALKEIGYQGIRRGDLVIHAMDAFAGAIGVADSDGKGSPAYSVCEPQAGANPYYYAYALREMARSQWVQALAKGIRERSTDFRFSDFGSQVVPLPPTGEQAAIVRFLDHANRRIRRYIRAKQRLIRLLEEQKRAIIQRAVTRGFERNVRFKPSGVEWLGSVPEHWDVVRLGRVVALTTGFPFESAGFTGSAESIRLLRGVNIAPGAVRWDDVVRWPTGPGDGLAEYRLAVGDIVLGMDRPIVTGGVRVAMIEPSDIPALLLQRVARIRPRAGLCAAFALMVLSGKGFADYLAPVFTGISVPHLSPDQIKAYCLALPPLREQEAIAERVAAESKSVQRGIDVATRSISLVREVRARLTADVVTGKLDVREAAAALPAHGEDDAAHEPEPGLGEIEDAIGEGDAEETTAEGAEA